MTIANVVISRSVVVRWPISIWEFEERRRRTFRLRFNNSGPSCGKCRGVMSPSASHTDTPTPSMDSATTARDAVNLGLSLFNKDRKRDAIIQFEKALCLDPDPEEAKVALYNKACCHASRGEGEETAEALRKALRDYNLKFSVILNDPDLSAFRAMPEFKKLKNEARVGADEIGSSFRRDLKLISEIQAPFRAVRKFFYAALCAAAGISTFFIIPRLFRAIQGGNNTPDLWETVGNAAINIGDFLTMLGMTTIGLHGKPWEFKEDWGSHCKILFLHQLSHLTVKNTQSGEEFIDPLRYKEREVFNGFHATMASECFFLYNWLGRNSIRNHMEFVMHSSFLVKGEMLQEGFIIPCTKRFPPLELTLKKHMVSDDFHVGIECMNLLFEIQWLHALGEFTQNYQARELRFGLGGMTSGDAQISTTKKMERIIRRRQDLWAALGKKTTTLPVLKQKLYRDLQLSIHAHTLRRSFPMKVGIEFMNFTSGSELDRCSLVAQCIITQWETVEPICYLIPFAAVHIRTSWLTPFETVTKVFSITEGKSVPSTIKEGLFVVVLEEFPTTIILIWSKKLHWYSYNHIWNSVNGALEVHHVKNYIDCSHPWNPELKVDEGTDFSFDFSSLCLWKGRNVMSFYEARENSSMTCLRHHKLDKNSDFLFYELLTHGSMEEPKGIWERESNYDEIAAVPMSVIEGILKYVMLITALPSFHQDDTKLYDVME
ncbi:hypothetical protein KI387_013094 [Taxus chinensis]|uniref:Uncharacterized protein n=1 Tax=Taxus chinensis TaxID=29808 RepID=A0AA38FH91_TAXCH|nr:hypothetical protein KI387_013094 [Taxus chinensis]